MKLPLIKYEKEINKLLERMQRHDNRGLKSSKKELERTLNGIEKHKEHQVKVFEKALFKSSFFENIYDLSDEDLKFLASMIDNYLKCVRCGCVKRTRKPHCKVRTNWGRKSPKFPTNIKRRYYKCLL